MPAFLGIPLWMWIVGGGGAAATIGTNNVTQGMGDGVEELGKGAGDGLRAALPIAAGALAVYAAYQVTKK